MLDGLLERVVGRGRRRGRLLDGRLSVVLTLRSLGCAEELRERPFTHRRALSRHSEHLLGKVRYISAASPVGSYLSTDSPFTGASA